MKHYRFIRQELFDSQDYKSRNAAIAARENRVAILKKVGFDLMLFSVKIKGDDIFIIHVYDVCFE